jgi:hypothetical protein
MNIIALKKIKGIVHSLNLLKVYAIIIAIKGIEGK